MRRLPGARGRATGRPTTSAMSEAGMGERPLLVESWAVRRSEDVRICPAERLVVTTSTCWRPPARSQAVEKPRAQPTTRSTPRAIKGTLRRVTGRPDGVDGPP